MAGLHDCAGTLWTELMTDEAGESVSESSSSVAGKARSLREWSCFCD
jgi:hypothetical protein